MKNAVHILDEALSSVDDCHNINARLYVKCLLEGEEFSSLHIVEWLEYLKTAGKKVFQRN